MSYGLLALLDDVAALAKISAASLDDIAAQSAKAGAKTLGIVIDDAAVTPKYVTRMSPAREIPAILRIARMSLVNKLVIIMPLVLLMSAFLPQAIMPLLLVGGVYLAFEGAEKVIEATGLVGEHHEGEAEQEAATPEEIENTTVRGAVRTDFILSSEIMVMTLASVAQEPLTVKLGVMFAIAIVFTAGVYGLVALIVRADDIGLGLARARPDSLLGRFGLVLVHIVPKFLKLLAIVGTVAMLWVGGSLILHGMAYYGVAGPEHLVLHLAELAAHPLDAVPVMASIVQWLVTATGQALVALVVGGIVAGGLLAVKGGH